MFGAGRPVTGVHPGKLRLPPCAKGSNLEAEDTMYHLFVFLSLQVIFS